MLCYMIGKINTAYEIKEFVTAEDTDTDFNVGNVLQ